MHLRVSEALAEPTASESQDLPSAHLTQPVTTEPRPGSLGAFLTSKPLHEVQNSKKKHGGRALCPLSLRPSHLSRLGLLWTLRSPVLGGKQLAADPIEEAAKASSAFDILYTYMRSPSRKKKHRF